MIFLALVCCVQYCHVLVCDHQDQFPDREIIRAMQHSLDDLILEGINDITNLADGNGDYDESQGAQAINNAASNNVSQG